MKLVQSINELSKLIEVSGDSMGTSIATRNKEKIRFFERALSWILSLSFAHAWIDRKRGEEPARCNCYLYLTNESGYDISSMTYTIKVLDANGEELECIIAVANNWKNNADYEFALDVNGKCDDLVMDVNSVEIYPVDFTPDDRDSDRLIVQEKASFLSVIDSGLAGVDDTDFTKKLIQLRGQTINLFNYLVESPEHLQYVKKFCSAYKPVLEKAIQDYASAITGKMGPSYAEPLEEDLNSVLLAGVNTIQSAITHFYFGSVPDLSEDVEMLKRW